MSIITRKVFLNLSLAAFASLVLASLTACFNRINPANIFSSAAAASTTGHIESDTSSGELADDEAAAVTAKESAINKAVIGIAGGESSVSILVAKAVELAGGLGFIKEGSTVLIKPNINTGDPYPASTNPEVVYEVINLVKKQNPGRILAV